MKKFYFLQFNINGDWLDDCCRFPTKPSCLNEMYRVQKNIRNNGYPMPLRMIEEKQIIVPTWGINYNQRKEID